MATNTDPTIQFFDNFVPKLHAGKYKISVTQTLVDSSAAQVSTPFTSSQEFIVKAPQYQIPAADVHMTFPPKNLSGRFEENLPHVVFNKKSLPWEQIFDENNENVPWIALLVCQIGSGADAKATVVGNKITTVDLVSADKGGVGYHELPPTVSIIDSSGAGSGAVVSATIDATTGTITGFTVIEGGSGYSAATTKVKIGYPTSASGVVAGSNQTGSFSTTVSSVISPGNDINGNPIISPSITAPTDTTTCQAVNLTTASFLILVPKYDTTVSPVLDEVTPLAHVRQVDLHNKASMGLTDGWCANVMAKRFPVAGTQSVNYAVHAVSLLGLEDYLKTSPSFDTSDLIQLISLYSWSFTCQPEVGETFKQLMLDLTTTEQGTDYLLRLPTLPVIKGSVPSEAAQRAAQLVQQGFVPLTYNTRQGEQTMALYRSPLTPIIPSNFSQRSVTDIEMEEHGSEYTTVPIVTVSGGGIEQATASAPTLADLVKGKTLAITSGGEGYLSPPKISFISDSLKEASGVATINSNGTLDQITVSDAGAGFTSAPIVTLEGGGIKEAEASAYLGVASIKVLNGGSGYTGTPTVIINGGGGSGASAVAVMNGAIIESITLIAAGLGYTSAPTISFSPSTGSPSATAVMDLQSDIQLASGGFGYATEPQVELVGGLPIAEATVGISSGSIDTGAINISEAGAGYSSAPTVILSEGLDEATAAAQIDNGIISSIKMISKGTSYTSAPTVTLAGSNTTASLAADINGLLSVEVTDGGVGYTSPVKFEFSGTSTRPAAAVAILSTGSFTAIPVSTSGSGYTGTAPDVLFTGGNSNATAVAVLSSTGDSVDHIMITSPGSGYTDTATVALSSVTGATAATLGAPTISPIGAIKRVIITDTGAGYSGTITVTATNSTGSPTTLATFGTIVIGTGIVTQIRVTNGGSGYETVPELSISGGGLTPALATANLDTTTGSVSSLTFGANTGSGYVSAPTIAFSGGGLKSASAEAVINNGQITQVQVTDIGQGYITAPTLQFYGGGFTVAKASAVLSGATPSTIASISIDDPGTGYTYSPDVVISGGGVREATAEAQLTSGVLTAITIADAGEGYAVAPTSIDIQGGIRPLEASANLENVVTSLAIGHGGSGYTSAPTVTIGAPSGSALSTYAAPVSPSTIASLTVAVENNIAFEFTKGTNFTISGTSTNMNGTYRCSQDAIWSSNVLTLYIDVNKYLLPTTPDVSSGVVTLTSATSAKAFAEISDGAVSSVILTSEGSGYSTAPTLTIGSPNTGADIASATATIATQVGSLTIGDPGSGYTTPPAISIASPDSGTQATARAYINDPMSSSSGAAIYNKEWGVFNFAYSGNFVNTRLLALSSKSFAVNVLQWKREAQQLINTLYERLTTADIAALEQLSPSQIRNYMQGNNIVTQQFMAALTGDYVKQLIPKFTQPIKPGSIVNTDIPPAPTSGTASTAIADLKGLLQNGDIQTQLHNLSGYNPDTGTFSNPTFKSICEWLASIALLDGIPFEYLVPDERMLPPSSIRFFYLDPNAIEAMIDGALSIGTHSSRDTLYYTLMRGVIHDAVKTLLHQTRANLLGNTPQAPPYNDAPITGFLLRSQAVKGWPGLEVKGYSSITTIDNQPEGQNQVPLLRMTHVSKDILFCLFDGVPEWIEIDEPGEGLTFGVEDGQLISLRQLTGSETGAQIVLPDSEFAEFQASSMIDSTTGALDVSTLVSGLQDALVSQSQLTPTQIIRVETNGGEGYTAAPTSININTIPNANITAQLNGLAGVVVGKGGTGYSEPPTITITDSGSGTGTGATAIATISNGKITAIQLLTLGENYTSPSVTITSNNPGSGATATASLDATSEIEITLSSGGSGYSEAPLVTISPAVGDNGTGATAVAVLDGDTVSSVTITSQGQNYTKAPIITFNTGSGASASAIVAKEQITGFSFSPSDLGTFTTPPTITIEGGTYTQQATAQTFLGTLSPGDLAVQMVKLPERMIFRLPQNNNSN